MDGSMHRRTPHTMHDTYLFDIDTKDNMLYYADNPDGYFHSGYIRRAPVDNNATETIYIITEIQYEVWSIAVDWIGRFVFYFFYNILFLYIYIYISIWALREC